MIHMQPDWHSLILNGLLESGHALILNYFQILMVKNFQKFLRQFLQLTKKEVSILLWKFIEIVLNSQLAANSLKILKKTLMLEIKFFFKDLLVNLNTKDGVSSNVESKNFKKRRKLVWLQAAQESLLCYQLLRHLCLQMMVSRSISYIQTKPRMIFCASNNLTS